VHADAVSSFLDDGQLTLASKADVPEGTGTRFAADDVWFHLENAAQRSVPAGYEFIAPAGSTVWLAPESNPGTGRLWPGFNTESIALGAIENDRTTFTLTSLDGPGDLEVYTGGGFEAPNRLWSSRDAGIRSFTIGRTHMHANWAFTASGTYRLGVEGAVTVNGVAQTASATYTFVVGDVPAPVATTTTLSASATSLVTGDPFTLSAGVTPIDAQGFIEFRNGSTVLGHEPLAGGAATFTTTAPAVGAHSLTAVYVPAVANLAAPSTSAPVPVTVTDGSGVEFGISGIASVYAPGQTLSARVVGHAPQEGEIYRWLWRQIGTTSSYVLTGGGQEAAGLLTLPVDMSHNGYEVSVQVRQGRTTVTQSPWVPLNVRSDVQPLTPTFPTGDMYLGDELYVELDGTLAEGDSIRVAQRGTAGPWYAFTTFTQIDADTLQLKPTWQSTGIRWTIQTVRDGAVIAQSEPVAKDVLTREVQIEGLQGVYRVGQTLRATARVYPELEGLTYTWSLERYFTEEPYYESSVLKTGTSEADLSLELPIDASHQGWTLAFTPALPEGHPSGATQVGYYTRTLNVSDSSPDTQLLFFESLGAHYHQGYDVNLNLIADPALADGDSIGWEWKWPDTDEWVTLPGASGMSHQLIAEQALDGVEVRAVLHFANGGDELISDPVTVLVDDHGSPARQKVVVKGPEVNEGGLAVTEGDSVTVSAEVENGTVLDSFQWFLKSPGAAEAVPIQGAMSAIYEFAAASDLDGAELSVAVVKPAGALAYGPSAPVTVAVADASEPPTATKPQEAPADRTAADLDGIPAGGIELGSTTVAPGDLLDVDLSDEHRESWVAAWLFSTPTLLGGDWLQATASGSLTVQIPADATLGEHRLAVFAADGSLIGWAGITVAEAGDPDSGGGDGTSGSGTGAGAASGSAVSGDLAVTGGTVSLTASAIAMLLVLAGILLVIIRRKQSATR
jgi:surface-anchored protein